MTTQFNALTEALALVAGDEMAVARGSETVRMALAVLRAGLAGSTDTAAQVLAKLLTVDGVGSDLDADLLDGLTPEEVAATGHRGSPLPTYLLTGATWDAANHTIEGTVAGITGLQTTDELILVLPAAMPGRGTSFTNLSVNGESRLPLRPLVDGSGFVPSQELVPGEILLLFRSGSLGYRLLEPHILERAGVWNAGRIYLRGQDVLRGDYDYKLLAETSSNERPEDHPDIWYRFPHLESRLAPLSGVQTFDVGDFKTLVNVDGDLVRVVRQHHAMHGQEYTPYELTDTNFLGFVARVSEVAAPTDGQFVFNEADGFIGGFEQYRTTGATGWYNYDPFASGEPWENAPAAATFSGALTYAGNTRNASDLANLATAAGQVFALTEANQVLLIDTFTMAANQYDEYVPRQVVPAYFNNPKAYFWLKDQTERSPDGTTFPFTLAIDSTGVAILEFVGADPDESYDEGSAVYEGGTALASTFRRLLHPPAGRHDFHIVLESDYDQTVPLTFSFYKDVGMADERYLGQTKVTALAPVLDVTFAVRFMVPDVVADGSDNFYVRIDGLADGEALNLRGFVSVEYKGVA